jgi:FimV-like protein
MSRGQNPFIWMVAISLPGASHALGLGELHINSSLNEPLAADIDIVGATPEELAGLSAKVANRETFTRFGADRPAFLSTTTFKVTQDAHGRPVLAIRSSDSFTEPLVDFVVDLRWHNGELVRQYTLLLDPAGFSPAARFTPTLPAAPTAAPTITIGTPPQPAIALTAPTNAASAAQPATASADPPSRTTNPASIRKTTHVKVGAKATLRGVAWRVGARSDDALKQTMIAIFRANPSAFEGNINVMHLGAMLTIPAQDEVAAIPISEARREVRAQMSAWRGGGKSTVARVKPQPAAEAGVAPLRVQPATPAAAPIAAAAPAIQEDSVPAATLTPASPAAQAEATELTARIKLLEQSLLDVQGQLEKEHNDLLNLQAQARYAEEQPSTGAQAPAASPKRSYLTLILSAAALLAGLAGAMYLRMRNRRKPKSGPKIPEVSRYAELDQIREPAKAAATAASEPVATRRPAPKLEPRIELSEMQQAELSQSRSDPDDTVDTVEVETAAHLEAPQEDDMAAARLREELALAWAIPAAEEYRREDNEEHTLAEAIAKSLSDTARMRAISAEQMAADESTIIEAMETANHTVIAAGDTAMLPAATVNMSATEVQNQIQRQVDTEAETVMIPAAAAAEATKLDYNLLDLDQTAQHVHMPSMLHEHVVVKERRTNLIDVLKMAIEREPERRDLHMKLLETYFAAAATNREAFLDAVQKMAGARALQDGEWEKIAYMGRQIAADSTLFEGKDAADDDIADCA